MKINFGELMAKARRQKGMTLRQLSKEIGGQPSFWSEIESGRRLPPKNEEILKNLASVLGLDSEKIKESAQMERMRKNSPIIDKIYNSDPDLAWGFCRAVEDTSDDAILKKAFTTALETLTRKRE